MKFIKNKKAFTLIELIVVMAIIAVLVLLAAPKFIGQTDKAKAAQIQNDIRVAETKVMEWLTTEDDVVTNWDYDDEVPEDGALLDKQLQDNLGVGGPLENISGVIKDEINTNLTGEFYSNKDGEVYYHTNKSIAISDDKDDSDSIIVEPPKGSNENPVSYTDNEGTEYSYYGEVSVDDLIRGDELAQRVKLNSGSPINSDENWLKISKGNENTQILYVAKKPYRYGIMWASDLYNLGITGDEAIKPYQSYDGISQTKYININGNKYRVRLLTNEEWDKIIIPLASLNERDMNSGTNMFNAGENGEGFTEKELGVNYKVSPSGTKNYVQDNDLNGSSSDVIVRGYKGIAHSDTNSVGSINTTEVGWRPVLEYVGPSSSSFEKGTYTDSDTGIIYNYNGKINSEDFITGSRLAILVGLDEGEPINDSSDWLYYSYGKESSEKHLLVAQKAMRNGIKWASDLYKLGLTGDVASKPYPGHNWYDNISQKTYITVKGNIYRVRLLTNDEWDHLIVPIATSFGKGNEVGSNLFEVGPNGEGLSDLDLGVNHNVTKSGTRNYVQDLDSNSDVVIRGYKSVAHYDTNSVGAINTAEVGWRPVLEYVKPIEKNGKTIQEGVPSED